MEVASPLAFGPTAGTGAKRKAFVRAPQMVEPSTNTMDDDSLARSWKRRRFDADSTTEIRSPGFPATSLFNNNSMIAFGALAGNSMKTNRPSDAVAEDLKRVVAEQAAVIDSLKSEKKELESSMDTLKTQHDRAAKENHILRKAVQIQQDRQNQAEAELKNAQKYREGAEEQMRRMEQMILSLRYHLQAQQTTVGNDFMGIPPRPPNVF